MSCHKRSVMQLVLMMCGWRLVTTIGCEESLSIRVESTRCRRLMTKHCESGIWRTNETAKLWMLMNTLLHL